MEHGTEAYQYSLMRLKKHPIFKDLNEETLFSLLEGFKLERWGKDTEFCDDSEFHKKFYVILKGRVKTFQIDPKTMREFTMFILTEKDVFDVVSLLDGEKHSENIKTLDDVDVLYAPMDVVRGWIEKYPKINKTLMPYLAYRMRMLEINLSDNVLNDIPTRLAKLILDNIDETTQQLQLINDLPNNEIASLIGSTRAVGLSRISTSPIRDIL